MDCNKDEAVRARDVAEMKMKNNDFVGARKIVQKAQNLYPELENISQLLSICDVHCSAQNPVVGSEKDWYGVLQVAKFADEMTIKKQYRKLALFLHPDKNRFPGAEAAFKLICEAHAMLSDPQKKSVYDSKIRIMVRTAPPVPPPHHNTINSQFRNQYGPVNGFQWSASSVRQAVFRTSCPFCSFKCQLDRTYVNTDMRCPKCSRTFTCFEMSAQAQGVPMQSKCAPESSQNDKGFFPSHLGPQWCATKQTVRPQPGVKTESIFKDNVVRRAAKVSRNVKARRKDSGVNTDNGAEYGDGNNRKGSSRKNKSKGRRRVSTESSESFDTSSESDVEEVTNLNSGTTHAPRRSSRKRQNVTYNERDDDDDDVDLPRSSKRPQGSKLSEDNGSSQSDALDGESVHCENQNGIHTDAHFSKSEISDAGPIYPEDKPQDKSDCNKGVEAKGEGSSMPNVGADAYEIKTDANSGDDSVLDNYQYDDPEFNDFDKDRSSSSFDANQYWACYDTVDGMPRFYARVKKVVCRSPFEVLITWLEAAPTDDIRKKWIEKELPIGCGNFRVGKTQKMTAPLQFAQKMHFEKGKRGSLVIHPRRGEVWALFRDWDLSWISKPDSNQEYKYEIVEVLSDFDEHTGVRVCSLDKVGGFVSLFQRSRQIAIESFMIRPNETLRFSHCIRSFMMTGTEREGVPAGSFELDPGALPLNPDHLYYPGKSKTNTDNVDPGVNCAAPTSG